MYNCLCLYVSILNTLLIVSCQTLVDSILCDPTEKKMRKSIAMLSDVWGLSNFPSNWLGLKGKFLAGSEEEGVEPVCGYCSMRNVHLKCNKCISHNQEDLMHGCEELQQRQCLLPLLLQQNELLHWCVASKGNAANGRMLAQFWIIHIVPSL